jgi:hypothetical protein
MVVVSVCAVALLGFLGPSASVTDRVYHNNEVQANFVLQACDKDLVLKQSISVTSFLNK